jgi:hypothetical protein
METKLITKENFSKSLESIKPSVGEELNEKYEKMKDIIKQKDLLDDDYSMAYR